jgi:hypothetical protein
MYQGEDQQKYGALAAGKLAFKSFIDNAQTIDDINKYRIALSCPLSSKKQRKAASYIMDWYMQQPLQYNKMQSRRLQSSGGNARLLELLGKK